MEAPKILGRWIEQLESGKLEQGTGRLHNRGRMCVLGVLCNASMMGRWVGVDPNTKAYSIEGGCAISHLPRPLILKLGFENRGIYLPRNYLSTEQKRKLRNVPHEDRGVALDYLNDLNFSFDEIAKLLRRYFKDNNIKVDYQ